jgi:apolipoprotein N-acyltransferase
MAEPTTTLASVLAASASTITLALIGVDHYSLVWGLVGALLALYQSAPMGRAKSVIFVALSTMIGAALGTATQEWLDSTSRPLLIVASLIGAFGAQAIITTLLRTALERIDRVKSPPAGGA